MERLNASTRQHLKRTARATLAFSRKRENHEAATHLHFTYYNLCRIHGTLGMTPAMAANITDHIWEPMELVLKMEKFNPRRTLDKIPTQRYTTRMEFIDYDLKTDVQTLRKIEKSAAEQGRPTKHLFRTRSAEEVSQPYSKTSTWKKMAEEIENPKLRSEFTQALAK